MSQITLFENMKRRRFLATSSGLFSVTLGGCSRDTDNQTLSTQDRKSAQKPASPSTYSPATTESPPEDEPRAGIKPQVCIGNAAPISIEVDDSGKDVSVSTVQTSSDLENTAELDYSESVIETAAEYGMNALHSILEDKSLLGPGIIVSRGTFRIDSLTCPEREKIIPTKEQWDDSVAPTVTHEHYYSQSGELLRDPEPTFEEIQNAAPEMARVVLRTDNERRTTILPVVCLKLSEREL